MDRNEWLAECSARLQEHWTHIDPEQLDEVAGLLLDSNDGVKWAALPPRVAAESWLRQGMPNVY